MRKIYSVSYDLKNAGRSYKDLYDEIKKCDSWWHYLESTWLISSTLSANELADKFMKYIEQKSDLLLVIEVNDNYQGWMPKDAWVWLRDELSSN